MTGDAGDDDAIKNVVASSAREVAQTIQGKLQQKTGSRLTEGELQQIIEPALSEVAYEITIQASHSYSGPMPSPQVMREYIELYPGAAAQLFQQFKDEQTHRHEWENAALADNARERMRRDMGAYVIVAFGIFAACFLAYLGATQAAAVLIGALVLGGGALVLGRQLLMRYDKDGTVVHVHSDEEAGHSNAKKTSRKSKSKARASRK